MSCLLIHFLTSSRWNPSSSVHFPRSRILRGIAGFISYISHRVTSCSISKIQKKFSNYFPDTCIFNEKSILTCKKVKVIIKIQLQVLKIGFYLIHQLISSKVLGPMGNIQEPKFLTFPCSQVVQLDKSLNALVDIFGINDEKMKLFVQESLVQGKFSSVEEESALDGSQFL